MDNWEVPLSVSLGFGSWPGIFIQALDDRDLFLIQVELCVGVESWAQRSKYLFASRAYHSSDILLLFARCMPSVYHVISLDFRG